MEGVPYVYRLAALFVFAAIVIAVDRLLHGRNANRAREYAVLMMAGVAGAAYGMINDLITSTLSPEYFSLGKGLIPGPGLTLRSMSLGATAGCSAAVIVCAVWLFWAGRVPGDHRARMRRIVLMFWIPFSCAAGLSVLLPLIVGRWDPLDFNTALHGLVSESKASAFRHVWWAHLGAYTGLLLGGALGMVRLMKRLELTRRTEQSAPDEN